ncbi:MAG: alpha-L-fucosidase [Planctomycetota bacterium]|nr:alpha-L-fucosidase [Planctomycetota bacterium]
MFIHWGLYAVPAGVYQGKEIGGIGEWIMNNAKIPIPEYEKYAAAFNPVKFDAREWARVAKAAGMRYMVITSKHHDGFCMFDTKLTDYSIVKATPFKRDPMKDLAAACKDAGLRFCFYHSILDWHRPDHETNFAVYHEYMKGQLKELLTQYGPIGILWFDGQWIGAWDRKKGERHLGLQDERPQLEVGDRPGAQAHRHYVEGRQLPAERRPDRRGRHPARERRAPRSGRPVAEGERRRHLRHRPEPVAEAPLRRPLHGQGQHALCPCIQLA